jgi:flagellar biosynthesis/type III secretory pathway protein FliH
MEPWGVRAFENDNALDWIWELEDEDDTFILSDAFAAVVEAESEEEVDAQSAEEAIAAAEVVAAMLERPLPGLPAEVDAYIKKLRRKKPASELVDLAMEAVERILEGSELRNRWAATEHADKWAVAMSDLQYRLQRRR